MILDVKYSIEKDADTYVNFIFNFKSFKHGRDDIQATLLAKLEPTLQDIIKNASNDTDAHEKISGYLEAKYKEDPTVIDESIKKLKTAWDKVGKNIINSLEFLYGKSFPFDTVGAYITTNNIFPYNYEQRYFFVNYKFLNSQLATAKHELNHFMFYRYYPHLKEKLSKEYFELLKESLSFFSNPDQEGKPNEQPLRELFLSKIWSNLDEAVTAGVEYLTKIKS